MTTNESRFWTELARARAERRHATWKTPLGRPIATPAEVFGWLSDLADAERAKTSQLPHRLFSRGKAVPLAPEHLATRDDGSMAGYVKRLDATLGEIGFVVNDFHSVHPEIWRTTLRLLAALNESSEMPPGGGSFDIFAGAYKSGFFGVHKDDQDVITFVVEGRKRFLLWPYEELRHLPGVMADTERKAVLLEGFDYSAIRDRAIVIEGGPGDVFFWPAEYWHVAESDGELCTTFGLGLFADVTPTRLLQDAIQELCDEGVLPAPSCLPAPGRIGGNAGALVDASLEAASGALAHPTVARRHLEKVLVQASTMGMRRAPRPGDAKARAADPSLATAVVRGVVPGALTWIVRDGELVWSVGGAVYRYPAAPALVSLMSRLGSAEPIDVAALLVEYADELEPSAVLHVLGVVDAHHALVRETRVRAAKTVRGVPGVSIEATT